MNQPTTGMVVCLFMLGMACSTAYAQSYPIDKGSFIINGSVSISTLSGDLYENQDGDGQASVSLEPSALYFVMPGLAVGGFLNATATSQGDISQTSVAIGPEVDYFFGGGPVTSARGEVYPFVGAAIGLLRTTTEFGNDTFESTGTSIVLGGGLVYMLGNAVGLQVGATYHMDNATFDEADESVSGSGFNLWGGLTVFLY